MRVLRQYIRQISEGEDEVFPEVQQRFQLRNAAVQVSEEFFGLLLASLKSEELAVTNFYIFADGAEASFDFNGNSTEIDEPAFAGDYAESLGDVAIDITVTAAKSFDIDADYVHDGGDIDDAGVIEVNISMPSGRDAFNEMLPTLRKELRGTLAHEMQHSVQKIIYGAPLDSTSFSDLNTHMNDPQEIDARVEETIAFLEDNVTEEDLDSFMIELESYVHRYLERNVKAGKEDPEYDVYYKRMIDSHLQAYKKKLGVQHE
jgi:hypothetical protein